MVAFLGPRIGKEHPYFLQGRGRRQGVEHLPGFGANKMAIRKPGSPSLALCPDDPVAPQIDADAKLGGEFLGIPLQKVAVAAAQLQHDGAGLREDRLQLRTQSHAALRDQLDEFRFEIHPPNWRDGPVRRNPEALSSRPARQAEPNGEAPPLLAFRPHAAAVHLDDVFHDA